MHFDPEALPELRKSRNPAERKNDVDAVKAALMTRCPLPHEEWEARYAEAFADLFRADDSFRDLLASKRDHAALTRLQDLLDAWKGK